TAEAKSLKFRAQIDLINFAIVKQAACPVPSVVGVAGNALSELENCNPAAFADRRIPPVGAAAIDELVELVARNDSLIGGAPRFVMRLGDVNSVGRLCAANLYEGRRHVAIEATNFAAFKPYR